MLTTTSTCTECAATISSSISVIDGMVWMEKTCPLHGLQRSLAERDPEVYFALRAQSIPIYDGHFLDVTTRCNLSCSYCYYPCCKSEDPSFDSIVKEALGQPVSTHFHGGEPTLREDIPKLMERLKKHRGTGMPTNGIGLLNQDYLRDVLRWIGRYGNRRGGRGVAVIALSWHYGLNEETARVVLESIRSFEDRISGFIFTIKSKDELKQALELSAEYQDCIDVTRIHVATDLWDAKDTRQIFTSDLLCWLKELANEKGVEFLVDLHAGSLHWLPVRWGGMFLFLARWYTKYDIDLEHLPLRPSYMAKNGDVVNVLHGFVINEAMSRGWCRGKKIER